MSDDQRARGAHEDPPEVVNPEQPAPALDRQQDPEAWVTGHEPMTRAQASYLRTLTEQAHEPGLYDPALDKAEASKRIDELRVKTGKDSGRNGPPSMPALAQPCVARGAEDLGQRL